HAGAAEPVVDTGRVVAAADRRESRDALSNLPEVRNRLSDFDDLARKLVAHDVAWSKRHCRCGFGHMQVRAADPGILHFQNKIVRAADRIGYGYDQQRLRHFLEYGSTQGSAPNFSLDTLAARLCHSWERENRIVMNPYATAHEMLDDLRARRVSAR